MPAQVADPWDGRTDLPELAWQTARALSARKLGGRKRT